MFGMILKYLRTGTIELDALTPTQLELLNNEVDLYQIGSLFKLLLPANAFFTDVKENIILSNNNTVATFVNYGRTYATSMEPFSTICSAMKLKIANGQDVMIGVASREILQLGKSLSGCG